MRRTGGGAGGRKRKFWDVFLQFLILRKILEFKNIFLLVNLFWLREQFLKLMNIFWNSYFKFQPLYLVTHAWNRSSPQAPRRNIDLSPGKGSLVPKKIDRSPRKRIARSHIYTLLHLFVLSSCFPNLLCSRARRRLSALNLHFTPLFHKSAIFFLQIPSISDTIIYSSSNCYCIVFLKFVFFYYLEVC